MKHKRFSGEVLEGLEKLGGSTRDAVEQMFAQAGGTPQGVREIALKAGRSDAEVADAVAGLLAEGRLVAVVAREARLDISTPGSATASPTDSSPRSGPISRPTPSARRCPSPTSGRNSSPRATPRRSSTSSTSSSAARSFFRRESGVGLVGRETQKDPVEEELRRRVEGVFQSARFTAPLEDDVRLKLGLNPSVFNPVLNGLVRSGTLVRLAPKVTYHRETIEAARAAVAGLIERHGSVSIAELRDRLDLSRKYAQAILEYFDRTGFTRRVGDRHVPAKPPAA